MNSPKFEAKWIGAGQSETETNVTFLARTRFFYTPSSSTPPLFISADSRYVLFLNGARVGSGPARGSVKRFFYDTYDVGAFLKPGWNICAAEVHSPIISTYTAAPVTAALFVEMDGILKTGGHWEVAKDPSRFSDIPLFTFQMGYSEMRDLRLEEPGWKTLPGIRSSAWIDAVELADANALGGRGLHPRNIPSLCEREFSFCKVVSHGAVPRVGSGSAHDRNFAQKVHAELHFHADLPSVRPLAGNEVVIMPSKTGRGAFLILDFEREMVGNVFFEMDAPAGTIVDIAYGECLHGDRVLPRKFSYSMADRFILSGGRQRVENLAHDRGFRFLQFVVREFDTPVTIHEAGVYDRRFPMAVRSRFSCDDPFYCRLWHICEETISACAVDTLIDCPWREQALWLNDMLVVFSFYLSLTGDKNLPARCLRLGWDGQNSDGVIPVVPPSTAELFPSMGAVAAVMLHDYYLYTGDLETVRELMPGLKRTLAAYDRWRNQDGLIPNQAGMTNFIDWAYSSDVAELGGATAILNVLVAAGYKCAATLWEALGEFQAKDDCMAFSETLMGALIDRLWDWERSRFIDCTLPDGENTFSQHPHAVGLFFDLFPESLRAEALDAMLAEGVVEAELYFQHFVISALAKSDREGEAAGKIRELWGSMVDQGAATVWEAKAGSHAFEGCGSLCHAFSCTPLYFMQTVLLGVRPVKAGFAEFAFRPRSLHLSACRGSIPTPKGEIRVEWTAKNGILKVLLEVPRGTVAILEDGSRLGHGVHHLDLGCAVAQTAF
jgi:alpha-L-rhamnosidase